MTTPKPHKLKNDAASENKAIDTDQPQATPSPLTGYTLTTEERRKGGLNRAAKIRAKREQAERVATQHMAAKLTAALEVVDESMGAVTGYATKDGEFVEREDYATRLKAAALLFDRLLGRPSQAVEVSGGDGDPIRVEVSDARERLARRIAERAARTGEAEPSS